MRTLPDNRFRLDRKSRWSQTLLRTAAQLDLLPSASPYNLTVSHEKKFIWYRVAKVGTRTIFNHFKTHNIRLDADHPFDVFYCPKQYASYLKFAFVRNPWDRLVSCWVNKVATIHVEELFGFKGEELERMRKFENFVEFVAGLDITRCNNHIRLQCSLIDLNQVDYLGRQETFDKDFAAICNKLDIPADSIVPKNVIPRKHYREYYTDATRDRVAQIYRKDVQVFGYEF